MKTDIEPRFVVHHILSRTESWTLDDFSLLDSVLHQIGGLWIEVQNSKEIKYRYGKIGFVTEDQLTQFILMTSDEFYVSRNFVVQQNTSPDEWVYIINSFNYYVL